MSPIGLLCNVLQCMSIGMKSSVMTTLCNQAMKPLQICQFSLDWAGIKKCASHEIYCICIKTKTWYVKFFLGQHCPLWDSKIDENGFYIQHQYQITLQNCSKYLTGKHRNRGKMRYTTTAFYSEF